MPQISKRNHGASTRALNWNTLPSTHQWPIACPSSQELMENQQQLISNAYTAFAKI
ncbi:unnamed protein product [Rhodiola kirilowii]